MNNTTLVFKNTVFLSISEFFLKAIGVVWIIFLAHNLSIAEYGRYNFVNSFIAVFALLPDLGMGLVIIREIAKHREKASLFLGNFFAINSIFSLLTIFLILSTTFFLKFNKDVITLFGIASLTLLLSNVRSIGIFYFDGTERMGYSALLNSINSVLIILFAVAGIMLGLGLSGVFYGMLFGTVISLFITFSTVRNFIWPKFNIQFSFIKYLLLQGFPLGVASIAYMVYSRIDSVILGSLLGEHAVGIYNASTPFVFSSIQLLNVPFAVAVYPALTRIHKQDPRRFKKSVLKSLLFVSSWSFPFAIIVSFMAAFFIPLIFGLKYNLSIPILKVAIFFVPFASLSAILYKVLIVINKQYMYLAISIFGAIVNMILNYLLIPKLSIIGAAYASVLTQFFLFLIYSGSVYYLVSKNK